IRPARQRAPPCYRPATAGSEPGTGAAAAGCRAPARPPPATPAAFLRRSRYRGPGIRGYPRSPGSPPEPRCAAFAGRVRGYGHSALGQSVYSSALPLNCGAAVAHTGLALTDAHTRPTTDQYRSRPNPSASAHPARHWLRSLLPPLAGSCHRGGSILSALCLLAGIALASMPPALSAATTAEQQIHKAVQQHLQQELRREA